MSRALIVVDVQESFRARPLWRAVSNPGIVAKVNELVAAFADELVVWVLHAEPGTGDVFDPALGHVRPMAGLAVRAGDPVLTKTAHNAFTTTNLAQLLTARGVRSLTVCGIRTEQCVETTARVASDLGYPVAVVVDASATFPIPHPSTPDLSVDELLADPRTLSAEDVLTRTEYALAGRFATITTVAAVTGGTLTGS